MTGDPTRGSIDETDAETETFESAAFTGAEGTESLIGQARILIDRPAPGEIIIISAALGQRYIINFDPAIAQIQVEGDNLVLVFDDGSRIVFENLGALAPSENAPVFEIAGAEVPGGTLFGRALALAEGEVRLETAAGAAGPLGTGATQYSDDTGEPIDLLVAEGVIPPVILEFSVPELELVLPPSAPAAVFAGISGSTIFDFDSVDDAGDTIIGFDDTGESQDVIDLSDIFTGPESFPTLLSDGKLVLDTSGDVGGDAGTNDTVVKVDLDGSSGGVFLPVTLVTVFDTTLDSSDSANFLV